MKDSRCHWFSSWKCDNYSEFQLVGTVSLSVITWFSGLRRLLGVCGHLGAFSRIVLSLRSPDAVDVSFHQ